MHASRRLAGSEEGMSQRPDINEVRSRGEALEQAATLAEFATALQARYGEDATETVLALSLAQRGLARLVGGLQ
jgi:hypothetical protein